MKKIFGLIFILFGGVLIGSGVFVQVSGKDFLSKKQNKEEEPLIVRADTKGAEATCDGKLIDTYIQLNDFTKISFSYPDCMGEQKLSYKTKQLHNEDRTIRLDLSTSSEKAKGFLNTKKTYLVSLSEEDYYDDFDYTDIKEMKLGDINYYYFNATYNSVNMFNNSKTIKDDWYISIPFKNSESKEERIITIAFTSNDKVISTSAIEKLIKSIKIEENKAEYIHSKEEGEYLVGSIKQNKYDSYDSGYILNYKVPKDIPEEATITTNINEVVFSREDVDESEYISISIDNGYQTIKEQADSFHKIVNEEKDNYKNRKTTGVKFKNYNKYNMYYFISNYDLYDKETKKYVNTRYTTYCFLEVSPNNYVKIYMTNKNIPITEKKLEKYLNFTIEEY